MVKVTDGYKWRLLWRDSQTDDEGKFYGHSFYIDEVSGKISLRDMSGRWPHETDDGVLWVDDSRPVKFSLGTRIDSGGGYASFPLICERHSEESMTPMRWSDAIATVRGLQMHGVHMRVEVEPAISALFVLISELVTFTKERRGE
jgi:hypothetical protein